MRTLYFIIPIILCLWLYTSLKIHQTFRTHRFVSLLCGMIVFSLVMGWMNFYNLNPSLINSTLFRGYVWFSALFMGFWATFILFSLPIDFVFSMHRIWCMNDKYYPVKKSENLLQKINYLVLCVSFILVSIGLSQAMNGPHLKETTIHVAHLPVELNNLKIIQLSDLHISPTVRTDYIEKVVREVNKQSPDVIFITGDIFDAKAIFIKDEFQALSQLKSRLGIFYVTGNHEYYWDPINLINGLRKLGMTPLINENKILTIQNKKILIAGITDPAGELFRYGQAPDMEKAAQSNEKTDLKIILSHRPGIYVEAQQRGFDLQFSGHTHGGQFFPFNILIPFAHTYYRGLNQYKNMWIYVNTATAYWGPPNRFAVPSEISLITLQKAKTPNSN